MKRMKRTTVALPAENSAATPRPERTGWPFGVLLLLFATSGCSALIYEILWFHMLGLVVGSSALSLGILLATYMGGLGLGSLLLPRLVSGREHPIRVYALLELAIAALAVLVFFGVPLVGRLSIGGGAGLAGVVARALIAALCLLPPTVLMGATLPAISRWVRSTPRGVSRLGALYSSNIAGGIAGCLLAGFQLLRFYDLAIALLVAVGLNLVAAGLGWFLARRTAHVAEAEAPAESAAPMRIGAVHVVIALSGLTALGGQVVWTRVLALLMGPTVYTFSIILAVFLLGLWIGSALGAMRARSSPEPARDLGGCQLLLVIAVAWSAYMVNRSLPWWPIQFSAGRDPWITFQLDLARCTWALLPPTLLWGASFPLALAAASRRGADPGIGVARVYAANTAGAILGSIAFTFLIPVIGTRAEQQLMQALSLLAGLVLLGPLALRRGEGAPPAIKVAALAIGVVAAVFAVRGVPPLPQALVALGRFASFRLNSEEAFKHTSRDPYVLFMGEGLTESVAVSEKDSVRVFHVSGKIEASTSFIDMRLQRMLGHLPGLLHPDPRSVLVVGCGAGVTAGSFVPYPGIRRIVICEIEPMVPRRVTPYFRDANHDVLSDPRVQIVYDDARHFVLTTREKFDIVTSDPIHPWVRGSGSLYSDDYFRLVKRLLNPGGVVSQWVPVYQASEDAVKSEVATFFSVFPHGTLWAGINRGAGFDMVMVGTAEPTRIDLAALRERASSPDMAGVGRSLLGVGFARPFELLASYLGRAEDLGPWLAGAHINRDRQPWLQYRAGWDSYVPQPNDLIRSIARYRRFPAEPFVGSDSLRGELLAAQAAQAAAQRSGP